MSKPYVLFEWCDQQRYRPCRVVVVPVAAADSSPAYGELVAEEAYGHNALGEWHWKPAEDSARLIATALYNTRDVTHPWQEHDRLTPSDLEYLFAQAAKLSARQLGEVIRRAAARGQLTQSDLVRLVEEAKAE